MPALVAVQWEPHIKAFYEHLLARGKTKMQANGSSSSNALREEWNRAAKKVGVKVRMYEGTKHSFASDAVRRGVPLERVQKYLGHRDRRSTERYAKLADSSLLSVLRPDVRGKSG